MHRGKTKSIVSSLSSVRDRLSELEAEAERPDRSVTRIRSLEDSLHALSTAVNRADQSRAAMKRDIGGLVDLQKQSATALSVSSLKEQIGALKDELQELKKPEEVHEAVRAEAADDGALQAIHSRLDGFGKEIDALSAKLDDVKKPKINEEALRAEVRRIVSEELSRAMEDEFQKLIDEWRGRRRR